jgi:hypothetical protein
MHTCATRAYGTSSARRQPTSTTPAAEQGQGQGQGLEQPPVSASHFRVNSKDHPLKASAAGYSLGDHTGLQQNHIWSKEELDEKMETLYYHEPKTISDHICHKLMYTMYHVFNFITGFTPNNPTVKAIEWRLIVLESVAGVPGFVAAGFRHFHSLRTLSRDYGWIPTLLEEAENERMHLLVCLNTFEASLATRMLVITAQSIMVPLLMGMYILNPKSLHRFVGYLEETACRTYVTIIKHVETPGTHLHTAWIDMPAPQMAIGYWKLPEDAKWVDSLKCMMADESHHRDVNHTFADMQGDDPNPFLATFKEDAALAWRLAQKGEPAWPSQNGGAAPRYMNKEV